tara:strand:- start:524 stop:1459 length:936 start_codon:yes stop_codon:yes gene_type:complete
MDYPKYFDPRNSLNLYGFKRDFDFLLSLYSLNKLPKILMLSGIRGSGKSTLINHLLFSIFDKKNYDKQNFNISESSNFYKQFKNNIFQNILYVKGTDFKSIKVEDIRNLKKKILQSSMINNNRFIILDDIEKFNNNSLNALLKIIEEPNKNNYFILINNKTRPLLETIKSRCLELKIILKENTRLEIIKNLVQDYKIKSTIDPKLSQLTPGNFIKFNYIFNEYNISLNNEFLENLSLLINLFKKTKDILFVDIAYYLADVYFRNSKNDSLSKNNKTYEDKNFVLDNLNKYLSLNLNQNSFINAISNKLNHG